ncbi:MAG: YigZ family protein [Mycoplasmoidaceae bacterium]|nr:YigZ family protein [Mycoplasmoidaceae bacterium]
MKILKANIKNSFTIKKSTFLCFGFLVNTKDKINQIIKQLKKDYPDASHICYAYVLDEKTYYFTDAGEPSGTAGQPIYNAIKISDLNYCLFAIVRYFGGIKFGPGPLRQTYKTVTLDTLKQAKIKQCTLCDVITIEISLDKVKTITSTLRNVIHSKKFNKETVEIELVGDKNQILQILKRLNIKPKSIKEKQVI